MTQLTEQNYFSLEMEREYMSNHLWSMFISCEAKAMAYLKGEYVQPENDNFKTGHIVEAIIQGRDYTKIEGLLQKNGKLYAKFEQAVAMAERAKKDKMFMSVMSGASQEIYTGEIGGMAWRCKTDCVNHVLQTVCDLKTTRSFEDDWMVVNGKNQKVKWYEIWNYFRQLAIQRELVKQKTKLDYVMLIAAVTKQDPPDIAVIVFDIEERFKKELFDIELQSERIKAVWKGKADPVSCGKCDYCRSVKVLTDFEQATSIYNQGE